MGMFLFSKELLCVCARECVFVVVVVAISGRQKKAHEREREREKVHFSGVAG